jgi:uncharacterized membrane protein
VHNTYFTLPVVFTMISNHYGFLYTGRWNWLVLVALMLAGALIRLSFVLRHRAHAEGRPVPWEWAIVGTLLVAFTVIWMQPSPGDAAPARTGPPPTFAEVRAIVVQRCQMCHDAAMPSKNVRLDSAEAIAAHAQQVYQQVVVLKLMPLNNATGITDAERMQVRRWFEAGAPAR